jgi:hypothetical protein
MVLIGHIAIIGAAPNTLNIPKYKGRKNGYR